MNYLLYKNLRDIPSLFTPWLIKKITNNYGKNRRRRAE